MSYHKAGMRTWTWRTYRSARTVKGRRIVSIKLGSIVSSEPLKNARNHMTMQNPCHPGEILRDNLEAAALSVTEAASRLGCTRQALSRLLNGKAGISPAMALALERIGWSNASFWMRLQAAYALAQERRRQAA